MKRFLMISVGNYLYNVVSSFIYLFIYCVTMHINNLNSFSYFYACSRDLCFCSVSGVMYNAYSLVLLQYYWIKHCLVLCHFHFHLCKHARPTIWGCLPYCMQELIGLLNLYMLKLILNFDDIGNQLSNIACTDVVNQLQ